MINTKDAALEFYNHLSLAFCLFILSTMYHFILEWPTVCIQTGPRASPLNPG